MTPPCWQVDVPAPSAPDRPYPVRVSVPLAKGADSVPAYLVTGPDGRLVPAQARPLVHWPDGSPRWVQLDFQAKQPGTHVIGTGSAKEIPSLPVECRQLASGYRLSVGRLCITIDPEGTSPVRTVAWQDRVLTGDEPIRFVVETEDGTDYPLVCVPGTEARVEALGSQRVQIAWSATHTNAAGEPLLVVRFRIELLGGIEGFSLSYQFFHTLPGQPTLRLRQIQAHFGFTEFERVGNTVICQQAYDCIGLSRFVRLRRPITLHLDRSRFPAYVNAAADLDDDVDYPPFLEGSNLTTGHAVALEADDVAMTWVMHEFDRQRPKTLTVSPGSIEAGVWPREAGVLELPQGRSCRQVFAFRFASPGSAEVDARLANPAACEVGATLAWLHPTDSVDGGDTWDPPRMLAGTEDGAALFSHLLKSGTARWQTIAEMFHYGDVPDPGYGDTYPAAGILQRVDGEPRAYTFSDNGRTLHGLFEDSRTLPKVWTNNEYDVIYCLALETSRTRAPAVLRKLQAAARHQLEVDFVHFHDHWQQHRATPAHSYGHVGGASAIASHQWTQGLYHYYVLTGDDDVPEVVRAICDFNIRFINRPELQPFMYFNRELGWALVALVFGYELTADPVYIDASKEILTKLRHASTRTDFDDLRRASRTSIPQNIAGIGGDFASNSILLGLKAYYQATGETWARELLLDWVDVGLTNFNDKSTGVKVSELFLETLCYTCELTGDRRPLEESLWHLRLFLKGFNSLMWRDRAELPLSTKQYARVYRGLAHYLSALAHHGLLAEEEKRLLD